MGGRGTFAKGSNVPFTYKTIGQLYEAKILQGIGGMHGLPEETHSSGAYIALNHDGSTRQLRLYADDLTACLDIDNSPHQGKKYLHAHDYVNGERQYARSLTQEELNKYKKYFEEGKV